MTTVNETNIENHLGICLPSKCTELIRLVKGRKTAAMITENKK